MKKLYFIFCDWNKKLVEDLEIVFLHKKKTCKLVLPYDALFTNMQSDVTNAIMGMSEADTQIVLITGSSSVHKDQWDTPEFIKNVKAADENIIVVFYAYDCPQNLRNTDIADCYIDRYENAEERTRTAEKLRKEGGVYSEVDPDSLFDYQALQLMFEIAGEKDKKGVFNILSKHETEMA